jgi:hypothetical protein
MCDISGTVTLGGDATFGDPSSYTFTADITTDHVLLRLNSTGRLDWATWFGGAEPSAFVLDGNGSIYAAGHFSGTRQFGSQLLTAISSSNGTQDGFLSRLDANTGSFTWTKKTMGKGSEVFSSITLDPSGAGSLYLAGYHSGDAVIGSSILKGSALSSEGFVAKADMAGNFNWTKILAKGTAPAYATTVVNGNVIVTGTFDGSRVDFGSIRLNNRETGSDLYVARMDASGNILWAINAGGVGGTGAALSPRAIASDISGNVFVSGFFGLPYGSAAAAASIQFGPETLTSNGTSDIFISELAASNGQFQKSWRMGGQLANNDMRGGLITDAAGNVWMTGWFDGSGDFPDGTIINSENNSVDMFLLRFSPPAAVVASASLTVRAASLPSSDASAAIANTSTPAFVAESSDHLNAPISSQLFSQRRIESADRAFALLGKHVPNRRHLSKADAHLSSLLTEVDGSTP